MAAERGSRRFVLVGARGMLAHAVRELLPPAFELVPLDLPEFDLTDEEIRRYIKTSEPFDKAGSYAVQGKGGFMVKEIKGSYSNVVGLPICEITDILLSLGILS